MKKYDIIGLEMSDFMFDVGSFIVYKKDVCRVTDYKKKYIKDMDYYELSPILDSSLKIVVPVNNNFIRAILSRQDAEKIIDIIPSIDVIEVNDKLVENEYKDFYRKVVMKDLLKLLRLLI